MNSKEQINVEISREISDLAFRFTKVMFEDDVKNFWECVSAVDQSRAFGIYTAIIKNENMDEDNFSFSDFIKENYMDIFKVNYEQLKSNPGIATHLRFSDLGMPMVFMLPNSIAPRYYIADAMENVFPLFLGVDTSIDANGELVGRWKIRLYDDEDYKDI